MLVRFFMNKFLVHIFLIKFWRAYSGSPKKVFIFSNIQFQHTKQRNQKDLFTNVFFKVCVLSSALSRTKRENAISKTFA